MPQTLGHSVSLVAALIIGDAAIATGLLSTPVILVAAVASIAVFVVPSLYEMATAFRFLVLLAAGVAGPVGLVCAALVVLLSLAQVSALGVPYCAPGAFPANRTFSGRCNPPDLPHPVRTSIFHLAETEVSQWSKPDHSVPPCRSAS